MRSLAIAFWLVAAAAPALQSAYADDPVSRTKYVDYDGGRYYRETIDDLQEPGSESSLDGPLPQLKLEEENSIGASRFKAIEEDSQSAIPIREVVTVRSPDDYEFEPGTVVRLSDLPVGSSVSKVTGPAEQIRITRHRDATSPIAILQELEFVLGEGSVILEVRTPAPRSSNSRYRFNGRREFEETAPEIVWIESEGDHEVKAGQAVRLQADNVSASPHVTGPITQTSDRIVELRDEGELRSVREWEFNTTVPGSATIWLPKQYTVPGGKQATGMIRYRLDIVP